MQRTDRRYNSDVETRAGEGKSRSVPAQRLWSDSIGGSPFLPVFQWNGAAGRSRQVHPRLAVQGWELEDSSRAELRSPALGFELDGRDLPSGSREVRGHLRDRATQGNVVAAR